MGRNRKKYREKKKLKKILEEKNYDLSGITNLYGNVDLTPYNAERLISKKFSEADVRY